MLLGHLMVGVLGGLGGAAAALFGGQPGWMALMAYLVLGNLAWVASLLLHMAWDSVRQAARQPIRSVVRAQPRGQILLKPLNVGRQQPDQASLRRGSPMRLADALKSLHRPLTRRIMGRRLV